METFQKTDKCLTFVKQLGMCSPSISVGFLLALASDGYFEIVPISDR